MSGLAKNGKHGVSRKRQNTASDAAVMAQDESQDDSLRMRPNGRSHGAACEVLISQEGIGERLAKRPRSNRTVNVDYEDVSSSSEMSDDGEEVVEDQHEEEEEADEPDDFEDDEGSIVTAKDDQEPEVKSTMTTRRTSSRLHKEAAATKNGSEASVTATSSSRMEKKLDSERKRRANNEEGLQKLRQVLPKQYARLTKADLLVTAAERLKEHEGILKAKDAEIARLSAQAVELNMHVGELPYWKNRARYFEGELMAFIAAEAAKQRHQPAPHHQPPHNYQHPHQPHYQHRQAGPPYPYHHHPYAPVGQPMPPFHPPAEYRSSSSTSSRPAMPPTPDSSGMPIRIKQEEDF